MMNTIKKGLLYLGLILFTGILLLWMISLVGPDGAVQIHAFIDNNKGILLIFRWSVYAAMYFSLKPLCTLMGRMKGNELIGEVLYKKRYLLVFPVIVMEAGNIWL